MPFPRIALLVPVLAVALFLPGFQHKLPRPTAQQIGMNQENFAQSKVTIPVGARLTFINNSHFLHLIAPGQDAIMATSQKGIPALDGTYNTHVSESGDQYTTGTWNTAGTYHLTCTLHPEMTLTVIVKGN
ncbi:MAG: plastocyanin/azurin family copper-binding protein [Actinomycetota bacterium]|nr:plastocyanin/azurin family copper-binding protein [Actinomycetota bacterium]MDQ2956177.1 plastocyanin/azurin family copper-binding protein [Actinomycetota bacterium]